VETNVLFLLLFYIIESKNLFQVIYPFFHGFVFKFVINNNSSSFLMMSDAKGRYCQNTIIKSFRKRLLGSIIPVLRILSGLPCSAFPETNSCGSLSINPCICLARSYFYESRSKIFNISTFLVSYISKVLWNNYYSIQLLSK